MRETITWARAPGAPPAGLLRSRGRALALAWVLAGLTATTACGGGGGQAPAADDARLAAMAIDPASVTVSGISAGGYMAVQFHVAHSALIRGAAIIAAGPYYCAEGSMRHALGRCMKGDEAIPTDRLLATTSQLALGQSIDPIAGLGNDRVWIFHGSDDAIVRTPVVDALDAYYRALADPGQVVRIEHPGAGHTFPTADATAPPCASSESPFVGQCGLDGARSLLEHLYGPLEEGRAPGPAGLAEFDQRPYAAAAGSKAFADRGWLFVPEACRAGPSAACRLHVVFHGCKQGASFVGDQFVLRSGYLPVAEANGIVLLFPQVEPSFQPLNPNGCWDWWGYEGDAYATQAGPQLRAVRAMIADLLGEAGNGG